MGVWLGALTLVFGTAVGFYVYRRSQRKARREQRRVEKPNSYYASPGVRQVKDIERWESIPVERHHAVNGDEIRRLLSIARERGPDALSIRERQFLDNMANL